MVKPAPILDPRTAKEIEAQLLQRLQINLPEVYLRSNGTPRSLVGMEAALVKVFARFSEIILERFNQVPDKNLLAFLNLLGATQRPPQPARVPVTFLLAKGTTNSTVIPAATQVAPPPAPGETAPIIFETEAALAATPARLIYLNSRTPQHDRWQDLTYLLHAESNVSEQAPIFSSETPIEHHVYLRQDALLTHPNLTAIRLSINVQPLGEGVDIDPRQIEWAFIDSGLDLTTQNLPPVAKSSSDENSPPEPPPFYETKIVPIDTTQDLAQSGLITFNTIPPRSEASIQGNFSRWLRASLKTPITLQTEAPEATTDTETPQSSNTIRRQQLPQITNLTLHPTIEFPALPLAAAFLNQAPIETTQPFYPFGEKPKFGNTFYMGFETTARWPKGGTAALTITGLNPDGQNTPTNASSNLVLRWDIWDQTTQTWTFIGASTPSNPSANIRTQRSNDHNFVDNTRAFTRASPQIVTFNLPTHLSVHAHQGTEALWIRVQIVAGDYGKEAQYIGTTDNQVNPTYQLIPATFRPPILETITATYRLTFEASETFLPEKILTHNDFVIQAPSPDPEGQLDFQPFQVTQDAVPNPHSSFYLGLWIDPPKRLANQPLTLFFNLDTPLVIDASLATSQSSNQPPQLTWQYWNGTAWAPLLIIDQTHNLTHRGLVSTLLPNDIARKQEFGQNAYWLKVSWSNGTYQFEPKLNHIWLNTTWASQTITHRTEPLGSSNGEESQIFQAQHFPILEGQILDVREPEQPLEAEQQVLKQRYGSEAVVADPTGSAWVIWQEVPDFFGSGPADRHYTLDHLTGQVQFGNGRSGRIPPQGRGNIRLRWYQSGGGQSGNVPAQTITQLKTTVPYVDKVINPLAASGGTEAEPLPQLKARVPRQVRHRNRAVTLEDYEDLAQLASPGVARAKCLPTLDLTQPQESPYPTTSGVVSVIIVPRSTAPTPTPTVELTQRILDYLTERASPTVDLKIVGPTYQKISITAELGIRSLTAIDQVLLAAQTILEEFLHPLTGGPTGRGWDFGRNPYYSDFFALLEKVPGVDYIRSLSLPPIILSPHELIASGTHTITPYFDPEV